VSGGKLVKEGSVDKLKGTTLEVYRFLLKVGKPMGVRAVQRALNLSSPSVAMYHLSKLEDACLVRKEKGDYVIDKVMLENSVRISRFLIPKYLFYSIFAVALLVVELTLLRPGTLTRDYFVFAIGTLVLAFILCYETTKTWIKGNL
jgi:DNA-binding transcriptional ArsR family regulator